MKVLQSLNISNNDLSEVPNELLARGVCNVFRINLGKCKILAPISPYLLLLPPPGSAVLHHSQLEAVLARLTASCRLRHLVLRDVFLPAVNQELLAAGCARLTSVNLQVSAEVMRSLASAEV